MKSRKWTRVLALCLAAVCLFTVAAALSFDLNSDNKVNSWDLQLALTEGQPDLGAAVEAVLGGKNELSPNAEGVYEIYSAVGVMNLAKHAGEGATFELKQNVDMKGIDWEPVLFYGTLNGNGYTISNVNITKEVVCDGNYVIGFFGKVLNQTVNGEKVQAVVKNLHLENVNVTVGENTQYAGLLSGTNKGIIENCTVTGSFTDTRTQLPLNVYLGALAGCNENTKPAGKIVKGTDLLTATAGSSNPADKVEGITAKMATFFADLSYPEGTAEANQYSRIVGIAGYSNKANIDASMLWQDITNSLQYKSATEQQRRQEVVDAMYQMGTVKWTPSETVTYIRNGDSTHSHSNAFLAGQTYTGLPYIGGHNGSYTRFMSQMQAETDDQGRYVTVTGLENATRDNNGVTTGFARYMGNNCSYAVGWAWAAISSARTNDNYGGVQGIGATEMVPTPANTATYGVLAVGGYATPDETAANKGRQTREVIALNGGAAGMAEYYALAARGDALVFEQQNSSTSTDAHTRMLAYEPVIIRNYKNTIDLDASYVITHEQGDGLSDNRLEGTSLYLKVYTDENGNRFNVKYTSWRIDLKYTLDVLLTEEAYNALREPGYKSPETWPGCGWGYVPVTMPAFTSETLKKPYFNAYSGENAVVFPNKGWYYSNYWVDQVAMVIKDADGQVVYEKTAYLLDRKTSGFQNIKLEQEFPDADDGLEAGQSYTVSLTATSSNGTVTTFVKNQKFVYTPG